MNHYQDFVRLFPVQKTLRMGLLPVGRTLENIQSQGVMGSDLVMKQNFSRVKEWLDDYHRGFIDSVLMTFRFNAEELSLYADALNASVHNVTSQVKDTLRQVESALCRSVGLAFTSHTNFPLMWKKEMFTTLLPSSLRAAEDREIISLFQGSLGLFSDYMSVRKVIYETKPVSGSVAYRLVCDNFPIFLRNVSAWRKFQSVIGQSMLAELQSLVGVQTIEELFRIDGYDRVLTSQGIEIYNKIIGGDITEDGSKVKGLNEYVNLYNQTAASNARLPLFVKLKKMILAVSEHPSWLPQDFEDDNTLLTAVAECYASVEEIFPKLRLLFGLVDENSMSGIFFDAKRLAAASQLLAGGWAVWRDALIRAERPYVRVTSRMTEESVHEKCLALFKKRKCFSLFQIADALDDENNTTNAAAGLTDKLRNLFCGNENDLCVKLHMLRHCAGRVLDYHWPESSRLVADKSAVGSIKNLLDNMFELKNMLSWFCLPGDGGDRVKHDFYNLWSECSEVMQPVTALYNRVRNYLTRKPYSTEKLQLNFSYGTFMAGWDADKDNSYGSFLARKGSDMYLAVIRKGSKVVLPYTDEVTDTYDRVYYKQISGAYRMVPKVFFSAGWLASGQVPVPDGLIEKYSRKLHLKGDSFDKSFCHQLIDYFKDCCRAYDKWSCFDFHFTPTQQYEDISQFYAEVENQAYHIDFLPLDVALLHDLVDRGDIYLFRIHNRDLSANATGRKSLQTLYYQMLFDKRNLDDLVYKLNGGACVYFRKKSLEVSRPTHPAGEPIANKNPLNAKKFSTFGYDLIKDRRYTVDKFEFHFPVTINACCEMTEQLNRMVNRFIRQTPDLHVIGINRGEHNLIYVTVIDRKGYIVEQKSLNLIASTYKDNVYKTDFQKTLSTVARERQDARKNWMDIKRIATLKQGYVSQAVHEVVSLLNKYKAVIAIEDLDGAFKNSRRMVEKEIYAQFEDALVNKLAFYVDKTLPAMNAGGLLRGLQLAVPAKDAAYSKQNGIVFKVPTWYIGMTCPATGFINFLQPVYKSVQAAKNFIEKFDRIVYNASAGRFEWSFDYKNFTDKIKEGCTAWTLCTTGTRSDGTGNEKVSLNKEMLDLFRYKDIDINGDLKKSILGVEDKTFFVKLLHLLKLTLQIRNVRADDNDGYTVYLISPVVDKDGRVWCSDCNIPGMPVCGDANDAYNIARRGLMYIHLIDSSESDDVIKLNISLNDWIKFTQTVRV